MKAILHSSLARFFFFILFSLSLCGQSGAQIINTIAGDGFGAGNPQTGRYLGDGGPATLASFNGPFGLAMDDSGNVYVGEHYNNIIRKIDALTGVITTVAGNGTYGTSGDGGPAINAQFQYSTGVAVDDSGNIYIAEVYGNRIRKVTKATGIIHTIAGNGSGTYTGDGGLATAATVNNPYGVFVNDSFDVYIADTYNNAIRKIDHKTGIITTVAGTGTKGYTGDGGPATSATMNNPYALTFDNNRNLVIADSRNGVIRRVDKTTNIITTIVGTGGFGYTGDGGPATSATLRHTLGVAIDSKGNIYVGDEQNQVVRKVDITTGIISTFAGTGTSNFSGDGGPANLAEMRILENVMVDKCDNVYIADFFNQRVRKVSVSSAITVTPNATTVCPGNTVPLQASGAKGYKWTGAGLSATTGSSVIATPTVTTTYVVSDSLGCATPDTAIVTIGGSSVPLTITPPAPTVCAGQTVALTVSGSGAFKWTPATGLNVTTGSTVIATGPAGLDSIIYTVVDTSVTICQPMGTVKVMISNSVNAGIVGAQADTICEGSVGNLFLTGSSNDTIQWQSSSSSSGGFTDISGANAVAFGTNPLTQTTYYRAILHNSVCTDTSAAFRLFVPPALSASYSNTPGGPTVTFTSTSIGTITFYSWDFGDGSPTASGATLSNPTHTFPAGTDTFNVCLTIYDGSNCSFTFCMDVFLSTGIHNVPAETAWNIYPSPVGNRLFISGKGHQQSITSVELCDVLGRTVIAHTPTTMRPVVIATAALPAAVYFVRIHTSSGTYVQKVVKE